MRRFILYILLQASLLASLWAQSEQPGRVMVLDWEGHFTPLPSVEILVNGAGSTQTDEEGRFSLLFKTLKPGDRIQVRYIKKSGFNLVNAEVTEQWWISPSDSVCLVMAPVEHFYGLTKLYYALRNEEYRRQSDGRKAQIDYTLAHERHLLEQLQAEVDSLQAYYFQHTRSLRDFVGKFSIVDSSLIRQSNEEDLLNILEREIDEMRPIRAALELLEMRNKP